MAEKEYEMIYRKNFVENKEFDLGVCGFDDDCMQDCNEYKQVFTQAEYLIKQKYSNLQENQTSPFDVLCNFNGYVERNKKEDIINTWGGLSSVFLLLTWYSLRILRSPWRKSNFKIKAFGGHFQHCVYSNFSSDIVEELMGKMGFMYHRQQQTFLFHHQSLTTSGSWKNKLMFAGMDFFLVHTRCSLASTQTGRSMPVHDVISNTPPLSLPTGFHSDTVISTNRQLPSIRSHSTLDERQAPPMVKQLTNSAPLPRMTSTSQGIDTSSTMSKRVGEREHFDLMPNDHLADHAMYNAPRTSSSASEERRLAFPWSHRLPPSQKITQTLWPPGLGDDNENLAMYESRDVPEPSIADGTIRYPPRDISSQRHGNDVAMEDRISRKMHEVRVGSSKQVADADSKRRHRDNYVVAMPMQNRIDPASSKSPFRDSRVESGYYSEWAHVGDPSLAKHIRYPTSRNRSGYESIKPTPTAVGNGEYVHFFPSKRPPGDGRPEPTPPVYQEIRGDDWNNNSSDTGRPPPSSTRQPRR